MSQDCLLTASTPAFSVLFVSVQVCPAKACAAVTAGVRYHMYVKGLSASS